MKHYKNTIIMLGFSLGASVGAAQSALELTFAQRLGWNKNDKVVIFNVDDAGMSYESNSGAIQALENGIATSLSVMMPCPWVPGMVRYIKEHPGIDAGLHLTHTSEWNDYRWGPLTGNKLGAGLTDPEGAFWRNVPEVLGHATGDEIETESMAQLVRARKMGFTPTHLDTHMGVLWASPDLLQRYINVGITAHIPVLFAAGHCTLLTQQLHAGPLAGLKRLGGKNENQLDIDSTVLTAIRRTGERLWEAGLAVVDDLYIQSYDWEFPSGLEPTDDHLRQYKTTRYKALLQTIQPGITVILIHCTAANKAFAHISSSGQTRKGDLLSMTDPSLKQYIQEQGIILTTWRELQARRDRLATSETNDSQKLTK